jgi:putative colanic acid biosynthesis acetyltransferase WcaF
MPANTCLAAESHTNIEPALVSLKDYQNSEFDRGASRVLEAAWLLCSALFFRHPLAVFGPVKVFLLRVFGARVGKGVVIKPCVQITFPWKLRIGDHVWIGEHVWIDNLDFVEIGDDACISQGALLLCGNHNYARPAFDLITKPIVIERGAWVSAKSVVSQGVTIGEHSVLLVGSVASHNTKPWRVYQGNPAVEKRVRRIVQKS